MLQPFILYSWYPVESFLGWWQTTWVHYRNLHLSFLQLRINHFWLELMLLLREEVSGSGNLESAPVRGIWQKICVPAMCHLGSMVSTCLHCSPLYSYCQPDCKMPICIRHLENMHFIVMAINSLVISCYIASKFIIAFKCLLAVIKRVKFFPRKLEEYDPLSVCTSKKIWICSPLIRYWE